MIIIKDDEIERIYGINQAIKDIENMLFQREAGKIINPSRTVIEFPEQEASALYMPCSNLDEDIAAMKAVTIFPKNPAKGKATTQAVILLSTASDGEHIAVLDASYLTRLRTGAMSGLATDRLARQDAKILAVIGTGGMAFEQVLGVLEVRSVEKILLFNPTKEKAICFKEKLIAFGANTSEIEIVNNASEAVSVADIICCSTRSSEPVFNGDDIKPGTHVNGVGSYLPHMREVDFNFIKRAAKIIVDDLEGVTEEAGELIHASQQVDWSFDDIHGELMDLITEKVTSREDNEEITFFKSVGAAYYDLSVANGVYKEIRKKQMYK